MVFTVKEKITPGRNKTKSPTRLQYNYLDNEEPRSELEEIKGMLKILCHNVEKNENIIRNMEQATTR